MMNDKEYIKEMMWWKATHYDDNFWKGVFVGAIIIIVLF